MILNLEQRKNHKDIEVSIIYPEKNKTVERLISFVNSLSIKKENKLISAGTILEIIGANLVITIGLFLTHKIEFRFAVFEYLPCFNI